MFSLNLTVELWWCCERKVEFVESHNGCGRVSGGAVFFSPFPAVWQHANSSLPSVV